MLHLKKYWAKDQHAAVLNKIQKKVHHLLSISYILF